MKRALGFALLLVGALIVAGGVYGIVEWAADERLTFAVQVTLGLAVATFGLFLAAAGWAILRRWPS